LCAAWLYLIVAGRDFPYFGDLAAFLEAPQNAAYNAPPFPAGRAKSAGLSRIYAMPHVAELSAHAVAFLLSVGIVQVNR
jgi:hypothetical protein